jgi:hypothetical protein
MKTTQLATRNARKVALLSIFALGACAMGVNSYAATATAASTAYLLQPISITKLYDLAFGTFVVGTSAGTIEVSDSPLPVATGGVTVIQLGAASQAGFSVFGAYGLNFTISTAGSSPTLVNEVGDTMAITYIHDSRQNADPTGITSFYVGGKLTVAGSQPQGNYTGSVSATVEYE